MYMKLVASQVKHSFSPGPEQVAQEGSQPNVC